MTIVHMIGNAHIDPVWLWGWQAGVDEALATLSAAADRCDEYPEFMFTRGDAWLYRQAERLRPDLFARIRRCIDRGQWHITGGMFVQPDLNLPTWVALERQIRHGQAYFQDRFSRRTRTGYNVDSFGHPAFLPDLLVAHGYTSYVFGRPDPSQLPIPFSAFRWRGAGGAELAAFRIVPGYAFSLPDLRDHIMRGLEHVDPRLGHTMCFYGVGDHGGGPTRKQIDWILEHRHALPGLELRFSTPDIFFSVIADRHEMLPVVEGELQHSFPGCYSAMGGIKRAQRRGEHLLDQAEQAVEAFLPDTGTQSALQARIDTAWDDLLFAAFHDIVTGTSTPSAWESCQAMQGRARITAEEVLLDATRAWAHRSVPAGSGHRIVVVNTDDTPFDGLVEHETWLDYDKWRDRALVSADGAPIPLQQAQPDAMHRVPRLLFPARIAPRSAAVVHIRDGAEQAAPELGTDLSVSPHHMANDWLNVRLAPTGIAGIQYRGRPLLGAGGMTLHLRRDQTDTWSTGTDRFIEPVIASLSDAAWVVEETGPLRVSARMDHRIGTSRLRWTLGLRRDDPCLLMRLEINFDERQSMLQLAAYTPGGPMERTDAVPGGAVPREISEVEFPVQGWSRLATPDVAMALVTQDAFSLSVNKDLWCWTLLRGPRMAWQGDDPPTYHGHDHYTDQGVHAFAFEFHAAPRLSNTALDIAARRMAQPLVTFDYTIGSDRPF